MPRLNMSETSSRKLPYSSVEEIHSRNKSSIAIREILKNGILVGTDKGMVRMPLKNALNRGTSQNMLENNFNTCTDIIVQGDLSESSFSDGITFWVESDNEKESRVLNPNRKSHKEAISGKMSVLYSIPDISNIDNKNQVNFDDFTDSEETLIGFSSLNCPLFEKSIGEIDELDSLTAVQYSDNIRMLNKSQNCDNSSNKKTLVNKKSIILNKNIKPVISVGKVINPNEIMFKSKYKTNNIGSVLINSNGKCKKIIENNASYEETSDNSEVMATPSDESKPVVKRGGWPKGRKRKPEIKSEIRPPKAPATGYVIFLNEKRKEYKDMPFTEVTKLLGNEWSRLSLQEKKVYLDQAEIEKKRYREELKSYRQSDAYRNYLHNKRLKRLQGNGTEESDMDATDEIDDEDNEELYCRTCDQWFHSLHNKKEHLYGRQHLQSIAGRCYKKTDPDWCNPNMSSTSFDESSLDGSSFLRGNKDSCCNKNSGSLSMDDAIVRFMVINQEREEERKILRAKLEESKARNVALAMGLQECNKTLNSLTCLAESERTAQILLEQRLFNLLNVPSLFYLPEPLNEEQQ